MSLSLYSCAILDGDVRNSAREVVVVNDLVALVKGDREDG